MSMNLERMKQAAIGASDDNHKWAVVCSDGDMYFAETDDGALMHFRDQVESTEFLTGEMKHDYGLVRVDLEL